MTDWARFFAARSFSIFADAVAILVETALSYLGLGVRGSDFSLGKLVSQYQTAFNTRPWLFWWPGLLDGVACAPEGTGTK